MKRARVADYWRKIYREQPYLELISVSFDKVPTVGSLSINLGRGISAITGLNGAGKSTVLYSIWLCLYEDASLSAMALDSRLTEGSVELLVKRDGVEARLKYHFSDASRSFDCEGDAFEVDDLKSFLVDIAEVAPALQRYFRKDPNYQDLLDQQGGFYLKNEDLEIAKYVSGRGYDSIEVFELELDIGLEGHWDALPYFLVSKGGVKYGVEHLGLGELSGLLIFWAIQRMPRGSVLLIDEPECYLASYSQTAISDLAAYYVSEKDVSCVITSHSDNVVEKIPPDRRLITTVVSSGIHCSTARSMPNHLSRIALGRGAKLVVVTEDNAATIFFKEIVSICEPALKNVIEVCWAGGSGEVKRALNNLPNGFSTFKLKFLGMLDGDQKGEGHECDWPLMYLPTEQDPEEVAKEFAANNIKFLSDHFARKVDEVVLALSACEGENFHDWPFKMADQLGRSHVDVLEACLKGYVYEQYERGALNPFVRQVAKEVAP